MKTKSANYKQKNIMQNSSGNRFVFAILAIALGLSPLSGQLVNNIVDKTFDSDGHVNTSIGSQLDQGESVAIQSDGKIVVAGYSYNGSNNDVAIARYNTDGSLDTDFDNDGKFTFMVGSSDDEGMALAILSDGKMIVAGNYYNGTSDDFFVARLNANGGLDVGFDTDGIVTTAISGGPDDCKDIAIQSDGKIVLVGSANYARVVLIRYNSDGSIDTSFSSDGIIETDIIVGENDQGQSLAIQSDGKIVVGASVGAESGPLPLHQA